MGPKIDPCGTPCKSADQELNDPLPTIRHITKYQL